jgi:DNA-methyltransferase (dcm)
MITIEEAAKKSGKSQKTIRRAIAAKQLSAEKIQNHYRIDEKDFSVWEDSGCSTEGSEDPQNILVEKKDRINWIDISDDWEKDGWKHKSDSNGFNFIDLFSGAGGLSCGLVMAGFTPIGSVEIMPQAVETYKYNFVKKHYFDEKPVTSDIRSKEVKTQLYHSVAGKKVDLIVGGFPCQGFSLAGYRVVADPRNSLYLEMLAIVKHIKPDFVVMENVEGLRSMLNGKIEEKIIKDYKKIGYKINVTILNSADYFTPQIRHRVLFIGNCIGAKNYHPKPMIEENNYVTLGQAIGKYMDIKEDKSFNHVFARSSPAMRARLAAVPVGKSLYGNYSDAWKKSPWDKPSCTIKENHGGVNIHPILNRTLTARELAALQTFPDDFFFCGSKKWQLVQIGNAVPCLLGKAIGIAVKKSLELARKK